MSPPSLDSPDRREFMKAVVAVGGTTGLAACIERENHDRDIPRGTDNPDQLPQRQHEWGLYDDNGNPVNPQHHILRFMNLPEDYSSSDDRETIDTALKTLERAYEWSLDGVIFTIGYSPSYFNRFGAEPQGVDLPMPEKLAPFEDPEFEDYDAVLHLTSNNAEAIVEAEEAMFADQDTVNGLDVSARLSDVFNSTDEHPMRRTGFVGAGLPKRFIGEILPDIATKIPEKAPLSMGFESSFKKNQASEDTVTISDGPFAGGTTQHISSMSINLNQWWNQDDRWQRIAKMFSPTHAKDDLIEGVGENLTDNAKMNQSQELEESASLFGLVGHAQKMISARKNDEPRILRRDFDTTDTGDAGLYFLAHHRTIEDFVITREAMNGTNIADNSAVGTRNNNGILQYINVSKRGNYLLPPRDLRALPTPTGN